MTITHYPIVQWIRRHQKTIFLFLAFAIPFAVRAIPEILMGPYIVGFDTLGFYIPNIIQWLHGGVNLWDFLATAPLLYTILVSIVGVGWVSSLDV